MVWTEDQPDPPWTFKVNLYEYSDLFVGMNDEIYFEHGSEPGLIAK